MLKTLFLLSIAMLSLSNFSHAKNLPIYVGTYTGGDSEGVYLLEFDTHTGDLTNNGLAAKTTNPSFVAVHPNGKHLYAVNETSTGELSAFEINKKTGKLKFINEQPSGGGAPCHLVVDRTGRNLLVANYTGGNVSVTRIEPDGSLGKQTALIQHHGSSVNDARQKEPHAHSINLDADNRFAVVADLGTDEVVIYQFDAESGTLTSHGKARVSPGSGPRHFSFHSSGKYAYAINELLSTISVFDFDSTSGTLKETQAITTLPRDFDGESHTAEVRVSANGKFVYGSNRGHDSIAVFRVGQGGQLTLIQIQKIGGRTPRNFSLDPSGRFLLAAGQNTNNINVFEIDPDSGKLTQTESTVDVPSPVCIRFAD